MMEEEPVADMVRETYRIIRKAMDKGVADNVIPAAMARKLDNSAFLFSGFKTAQELKEAGVVNFVVPADKLQEEAMNLANRLADQPAESIRMLKYEINKTYEIMGMRNAMDFAAEMFNLCRINQVQEQAEFNKIVNEQGLKAALAWKAEQEAKKKQ